MKKEDILTQIKNAKNSHIDWVYKAKTLMNTKEGKENFIPIDTKECGFAKWFFTEGQKLSALSNNPLECMENISQIHHNMHDIYFAIFIMYYPDESKKALFSKFFGEKKRVLDEDEVAFVLLKLKKLEEFSNELLDELNRLERRIVAVSDEKIEGLG